MSDLIRITIIKGCDAQGAGGTVADSAAALLPDGTAGLIEQAFQDAYGLYSYPDPANPDNTITVSPSRNVTYALRQFATEMTQAFVQKQAAQQAAQQAAAQFAQTTSAVQIIE